MQRASKIIELTRPLRWGVLWVVACWLFFGLYSTVFGLYSSIANQQHEPRRSESDWVSTIVSDETFRGETEVTLWDGSRVDILNDRHAIEVDWARKWAEGVGQALFYARMTGRDPGLILLVRDGDERYMARAVMAAGSSVRVWFYDVEHSRLRR